MKKLKKIALLTIFCLAMSTMFVNCEEEEVDTPDNNQNTPTATDGMMGTWSRNDGQATTFLKLNGGTATSCNNGTETLGTFNSSVPSATFVISGTTIVFPLRMLGNKLIVQVPSQGNANHVDTEYIRSTNWPCGGGGNQTGTNGDVIFWTRSDQGCGPITVTINGSSSVISSYYTSGSPSCGAGGGANFNLSPGNYNFTARCSNYNWSGSVTISANGCLRMELT